MNIAANLAGLIKAAVSYGAGTVAAGSGWGSGSSDAGRRQSSGVATRKPLPQASTKPAMNNSQEMDAMQTTAGVAASVLPVGAGAGAAVNTVRASNGAGKLRTAWNAAKAFGTTSSAASVPADVYEAVIEGRHQGGTGGRQASSVAKHYGAGGKIRTAMNFTGRTLDSNDPRGTAVDMAKSHMLSKIPGYNTYDQVSSAVGRARNAINNITQRV